MKVIGYLVSGYPSLEGTVKAADAFVEGGCDMFEISIPLINNFEAPYLHDLMVEAFNKYPDYETHLQLIAKIAKRHPEIPITILLYNEVSVELTPERIAEVCAENGIRDINSPNLTDQHSIDVYNEESIDLAGLILYHHVPSFIEASKKTKGFIYCQAFPREGQEISDGCDTPQKQIAWIRQQGINNPIYCGGGVRTSDDVYTLKKAGADGFFLGTSLLTIIEDLDKIVQTVRYFREAADQTI